LKILLPNRVTLAEQKFDIRFLLPLQNQFIVDEKSFFIRFVLKLLPLPLKLKVLLVLKPEARQEQKAEQLLLFCFTLNKRATLLLRTVTTS
jgi:hypothetical protein